MIKGLLLKHLILYKVIQTMIKTVNLNYYQKMKEKEKKTKPIKIKNKIKNNIKD